MTNPNDKPVAVITGVSGLIGMRLARALADDYDVVGLDIETPDGSDVLADFLECDLRDDDSVERAMTNCVARHGPRVASVVHLAAYYDFSGESSPLYRELTVEGTRRLLRALRSLEVEQLVFSSTLLVMEPVEEGERLTEEDPLEGEWDYPRSKIAAERVLREERGEVPVAVLRLAGAYDEDGNSPPLGQQILRIYREDVESFFFPGDSDHGQAYVHLDDAVRAFERTIAARRRLDGYEVFLVAEPDVMSYRELQERIGEALHGRGWPTLHIPRPIAKAGAWVKEKLPGADPFIKPWMIDLADDHYPVEIARARERLGWEPRHRLRDTLDEMLRRLKADPERWFRRNGLPVPDTADAIENRR